MSIKITDLEFSYDKNSSRVLLKIPSLEVAKASKLFLYGPSGSGKSTFLSLLTGVLKAQKGEIRLLSDFVMSRARAAEADAFRGEHMGYIFQQFNLLPQLSVRDNIILSLELNWKRKQRLLDQGLNPFKELERLAADLDILDILEQSANRISVGQQQRAAAARALIGAPEIIIADEPTSSLDAELRDTFVKMLIREVDRAQSTLIFVSHDHSLKTLFTQHRSILDWKVAQGVGS